ncbi:MAG: hypothetical protein FJX74_20355, partial [Armatimonadetes bacterium]|nr:hypothetical protein [Armatimonadota bacterium]
MITKVHARNYRSLGDVEVELGPLTVLVGPNGSGKSNFVDVLHFLKDAFTHGLDAAIARRGGIGDMRRWSLGRPRDIALRLEFSRLWSPQLRFLSPLALATANGRYGLEIGSASAGQCEVKGERLHIKWEGPPEGYEIRGGKVTESTCELATIVPTSSILAPTHPGLLVAGLVETIRGYGFYSILPNVLREPQKPGNDWPLDTHGSNLSSVLRGMRKADSRFLPEVVRALGYVVPGIQDVRVVQVGGYLALKLLHEDGKGRRHWFDAAQESDGTLRVLGVLTALYQDPPPALIAIEEPELTVQPGALALLRDCIVEAADKRTQVIITTHSPDLMSLFDVDVLRVVAMTEGGTRIGPVAEWQKQSVRDQLFSPGELMLAEGL